MINFVKQTLNSFYFYNAVSNFKLGNFEETRGLLAKIKNDKRMVVRTLLLADIALFEGKSDQAKILYDKAASLLEQKKEAVNVCDFEYLSAYIDCRTKEIGPQTSDFVKRYRFDIGRTFQKLDAHEELKEIFQIERFYKELD